MIFGVEVDRALHVADSQHRVKERAWDFSPRVGTASLGRASRQCAAGSNRQPDRSTALISSRAASKPGSSVATALQKRGL